jgi:hypothetical protein
MSVAWESDHPRRPTYIREDALPSFNIGRLVRWSMLGAVLGYCTIYCGIELYVHLVHPFWLQLAKAWRLN